MHYISFLHYLPEGVLTRIPRLLSFKKSLIYFGLRPLRFWLCFSFFSCNVLSENFITNKIYKEGARDAKKQQKIVVFLSHLQRPLVWNINIFLYHNLPTSNLKVRDPGKNIWMKCMWIFTENKILSGKPVVNYGQKSNLVKVLSPWNHLILFKLGMECFKGLDYWQCLAQVSIFFS